MHSSSTPSPLLRRAARAAARSAVSLASGRVAGPTTHAVASHDIASRTIMSRAHAPRWLAAACFTVLAAGVAVPALAAPLDTMVKAAKFNDVSAARKMLSRGVDPNAVDEQGMPLLLLAAREKSNDVAMLLMQDKRTDVDKLDPAGENAMMLAAIAQDAPLVKALIDKGAEVNKKGWTPLHYAASIGDDAIVKMLLEASAYIDAASPNGTTPLMMAARGGHASTINLLIEQGADPTLKNQIGMSALDFAKHYNEKDGVEALSGKAQAWQASHAAGASAAHAQ